MSLLRRALGRIPEELPLDTNALDRFSKGVLGDYGLPHTSEYLRAVASAIQQATQGGSHKVSRYAIYSFIRRASAMRAAFLTIQSLNKAEASKDGAPEIADGRV